METKQNDQKEKPLAESGEKMNEENGPLSSSNPNSERAKVDQLEESLEKASKRQKISFENTNSHIESIISELKQCKSSLQNFQLLQNSSKMESESLTDSTETPKQNLPSNRNLESSQEMKPEKKAVNEEEVKFIRQSVGKLVKKVKSYEISSKISKENKEIHASISKIGKFIEKFTSSEIDSVFNSSLPFDKSQLNQIIIEHFLREGSFEIAEILSKEAKVDSSPELKESLQEMYRLLDSIKNRNLEPAIQWAKQKRVQLFSLSNFIEFKFHKLQFIWFLTEKKSQDAIQYARSNFADFASLQLKEIQRLMASLLFIENLEASPYTDFLSPTLFPDLITEFIGTSCSLLGLSYESALHKSLTAGSLALPKQIKAASLLHKSLRSTPIEVELGPDFQFHPIFACPVSKEQTTPENPPMLLTCGHVISKTSMQKITRGGNKVKCPYCPTEQKTKDIIEMFF